MFFSEGSYNRVNFNMAAPYENYFRNSLNNIKKKQVVSKLKDSNTAKSNYANPHYRSLIIQNIPRIGFYFLFCKDLHADELRTEEMRTKRNNSEPLYSIRTFTRLQDLFPEGLFRVRANGDTTLITPFSVVNVAISIKFNAGKRKLTVAPGKLVLPLVEKKGRTLVFFLCSGLTDEDEVPDWVEDFFPMDLKILSHPSVFMTSPGIGTITCNKKNLDWANIPREQEIEDGSLLKVRSEFYEVLG